MESAPDIQRRRFLQASLGAATLFMPAPYAWVWAQTEGTLKLLRAPKFALVIGNSSYKRAPLKNPANDARAISDTLKSTGFDVTVRLDAVQADLAAAVQTYTQLLAQRKGVGLFYFAGHGLQLAWRNYMIPVDADIRSAADIQTQGVEVGALLGGISKAANPLNVIILDACRDNPFGNLSGVDQKGLSQVDAPSSTLLAYATAPGNVASDGEGVNGLYTENLLREMRVPEAKIEDVFKRVRLNVRRRTNGQQIPWESTSLEEDFWFVPPKDLKKVSDAEAAREFEVESALWEKIKASTEPEPFERYLLRYPSGKFAELAQFQLDRLLGALGEKKVEIGSQSRNPFTKGSNAARTDYKIGDFYTYRVTDLLTKLVRAQTTVTVTAISATEVIYNNGLSITDFLGNHIREINGRLLTGSQYFAMEYSIGKKWVTRFILTRVDKSKDDVELEFTVIGKEFITVPAGTFEAWKVEGKGFVRGAGAAWRYVYWIDPEKVRRFVAMEYTNHYRGQFLNADRFDLMAFGQS